MLWKVCGVAVLAAAAALVLGKEKKWTVILCAVMLIFWQSLGALGDLLQFVRQASGAAAADAYTSPMLKGLGIGAVSYLGSCVCREADAAAAADALEIYAGLQLLLLCLPFAEQILGAVRELAAL